MRYKQNFRVLIVIHLVGILIAGGLLFFMTADSFIVKTIIGALLFSLGVQLLIYRIKPTLFGDKISKHPDVY